MGRRFAVVSFLTDFGLDDVFVGVCHGVLARAAPHARVVDLTHAVTAGDVVEGALLLARAVPHLPESVHLAVVDPGVGTARRGIAVATARGDVLVGPDNGLLLPAAEALGGRTGAWSLESPEHRLLPTSATFHGRDVFSPAAGAVASGAAPSELGPPVADPVRLELPRARPAGDGWEVPVVLVDRFGNLQLGVGPDVLAPDSSAARVDGREVPVVATFGDLPPGELGLYVDSDGQLALAVNGGSAADRLGLGRGDLVTVGTAPTRRPL